jgi:hypothetical protein
MFCAPVALHGKVVGLLQGQVALEVADSVQPSNTRAEKIKKLVQWHGLLHEWRLLQTAAQSQLRTKKGGGGAIVEIVQHKRGVHHVGRKRVSVAVNLNGKDGKHSAKKKLQRIQGGAEEERKIVAAATFGGGTSDTHKGGKLMLKATKARTTINLEGGGADGSPEKKDEGAVQAHQALMAEFFKSTQDSQTGSITAAGSLLSALTQSGLQEEDEECMDLDCEVCGKSGREVDLIPALGRGWCSEHFKCEHCERPLGKPWSSCSQVLVS